MDPTPTPTPPRLRHPWLYALPGAALPATVTCDGAVYELVETFKHDFFAATGLYRGPAGLAVLKVGRINPAFSVPLDWIGRVLAGREVHHYRVAEGLPGVPRLIGRVGPTGLLHAFVPGHPLGRREAVSDTFFDELRGLLDALHARDMAYVDLNKRQNILVGDDGRPYLIDFQISLHVPRRGWRGARLAQWVLRRFQDADTYHLLKHKRRLRPDLLTEVERERVERIGFWIRLHRLVARPLTALRRRTKARLTASETGQVAGAGAK